MRAGDWPTGTVTFLMTDVVGSSSLAEADPGRYLELLARHDDLARRAVEGEGGVLVKHRGEGDSIFAAFGSAEAGARAAQTFLSGAWRELGLELRAALHCGEAALAHGDYRGDAVNRCGRLRGLAAPRQVLLSGSVASLLASVSAQPLGPVRLRGLVRSVELFVLVGEGLVQGAPPGSERRGNLVAPAGRLYGRKEELAGLGRAFERRRIVELVGPGGAGKTRLAAEFGARSGAESFPGGVWFVDLTRTEGAPIEPTVLNELGLSAPGERDAAAVVAQELGSAGEALLILDNGEHVAAAVAGFLRRLGSLAPSLRVLLTSLEPLALAGVATVKVGPLGSDAAAVAMLRDFAEARAIAVVGSDEEVAGLCRDLDGLPLAIELAVPRLRTLSVAAARARLRGWLGRVGTSDGVGDRQASLGALVAYSLGRLSEPERDLLESLVRFAGGFTLEHAEAVCACEPEEAEETLGSLLERSMVSPDEQGSGGEPRFRLLSAVRAGTLAATADAERRGAAFVRWAAEWADAGVAAGAPFGSIRAELANLEAAFDDALELEDVRAAARIARGLRKIYFALDAGSGRRRYEALRGRLTALSDEERGDVCNSLGIFRLRQNDLEGARSALLEALAIFETLEAEERVSACVQNLAVLEIAAERYEAAGDCARRAIRLHESSGRSREAVNARQNLALALLGLGEFERAAKAFEPLREIGGEEGRAFGDSFAYYEALHHETRGSSEEAETAFARIQAKPFVNEALWGLLLLAAFLLRRGEREKAGLALRGFDREIARRGFVPSAVEARLLARVRSSVVTLEQHDTEEGARPEELFADLRAILVPREVSAAPMA